MSSRQAKIDWAQTSHKSRKIKLFCLVRNRHWSIGHPDVPDCKFSCIKRELNTSDCLTEWKFWKILKSVNSIHLSLPSNNFKGLTKRNMFLHTPKSLMRKSKVQQCGLWQQSSTGCHMISHIFYSEIFTYDTLICLEILGEKYKFSFLNHKWNWTCFHISYQYLQKVQVAYLKVGTRFENKVSNQKVSVIKVAPLNIHQ